MDQKQKKATINSRNKEGNCFQYPIMVALNHKQIKRHLQRIAKICPFINLYEWKNMNFSEHAKHRKKSETSCFETVFQCFVHSIQKGRDNKSIHLKTQFRASKPANSSTDHTQ